MKRTIALFFCTLGLVGAAPGGSRGNVDVVYAGSLVTTMEGPIAAALPSKTGLTFVGEGRGSKELYNLIVAGLRKPDVFISADDKLTADLVSRGLATTTVTFANASMVLGYSDASPQRALLDRVASGQESVKEALLTPGLRIARTDPALDPKGARTLRSLALMGLPQTLGTIYPEESLLTQLEAGTADVGFLYSTEAIARKLHAIPLPGAASLSGEITYSIAILKNAPHPAAASTFENFILSGDGKSILEAAGLTYRP